MDSKIVITSDFNALKADLEAKFGTQNLRFFICDDFLLENAKDVISEAYISENSEKLLVIAALSYKTEAQNSLLKIIEEPPRNIKFLLAVPAKNLLLPTIRSRLIIENLSTKKERAALNLNLKSMSLKDIYSFLDECINAERADKLSKNELKELIANITTSALNLGYKFSQDELSYFYSLMQLAELNAKCTQILTPLLLTILNKGRV